MWVLQLVVATCLASSTLAAPQLFPFTNLKKYFDHRARDGPNPPDITDLQQEPTRSLPTPPVLPPGLTPPGVAPAFNYAPYLSSTPHEEGDAPFVDILRESPKPARPTPNTNPSLPGDTYKPFSSYVGDIYKPNPSSYVGDIYKPNPSSYEGDTYKPDPSSSLGDAYKPIDDTYKPIGDAYKPIGDTYKPNPSSFLVDAFKPKLTSSIGDAYKPKPTSSISDAYKPKPSSSIGDAYKPNPSSSMGDAYKPKPNALTNKYPKKYQSELLGYGDGDASDLYAKKKNHSPKKEHSLLKEQQYQTSKQVAKTITAAHFQKEPKLLEGTLAYRKPYYPQSIEKPYPPHPIEQQASESGFHGISSGADAGFGGGFGGGGGAVGGGGERVEFQMHGHHGPHSYKFGYDTGKGHNRQFRFEERDASGHVKGHYGFYDKSGKLQMVNYHADHHGFHADGNFGNHANR